MVLPEVARERLYQYWLLMRFHRPIGIFLVLWPALWALWIAADGHPSPGILLIFVLGATLMRAAGCVINDYADRKIDPRVSRTRDRPLASGKVGTREALWLFAVLCLMAFALVLLLNPLTIKLSFAAVGLAVLYPFTKRFTHLPQVFLGAAFAMAVPMAFAAEQNAIPGVAWVLYLATLLWALVYDTQYAMVDRDEDLLIGVKSTAILFGVWDRPLVAVFQVLVLALLLLVGWLSVLHWPYYLGLVVGAGLFVYQQVLMAKRERGLYFRAFLNNAWFGALVFGGLVVSSVVG